MMALFPVACPHIYLIISVIFTFFVFVSTTVERQLVANINPGCPPDRCNDSVVEVIHVRGDGPNDTLHYVWCFHNKPTILLALTSHAANLSVRWEDFPENKSSISFTTEPHYSFGVLINQIFEFNDVDDVGIMNMSNSNKSYIHMIEMPDSWVMKHFQQNRNSVLLIMEGSWKNQNQTFVKEGLVRVELETYRTQDHGPKLPHLLHSSNATQIELSLWNMLTHSGFEQSRYAVELVLAANESAESSVIPSSFKSLDDEHTPGVFTLVDLQTTASKEKGNGGYLQWRPVAYVADERDIVNSTETALYPVTNRTNTSKCEGTLLAAYFGSKLKGSLLSAVNVSFGAKDDGFYSKYNASIWTATVGYGHPPDENFSLLVILIMSMCLGLPAIIIVLSCLYIALRRISYRKDDLLLSR